MNILQDQVNNSFFWNVKIYEKKLEMQ